MIGEIPVPRQLSLGVQLDDDATFENFYPGSAVARQALAALEAQLQAHGEQLVYLAGPPGAGVSHLLQAACHAADLDGRASQYLPLAELQQLPPEQLLQGLDSLDLLCLDDLQAVAGQAHWERALFHCFNRLRDSGRRLVLGAARAPRELAVQLPDLQSRLSWGLVFQLPALSDEQKCRALQLRAGLLGLELSEEVARFILHRWARDSEPLFDCLRRLDRASLEQQRRLTIPFVKRVLGV